MREYIKVPKELIEETLATPWSSGKKELEPFRSFANEHGLPFKIHEHPEDFGDAEVHLTEADWWIVIQGSVEFIVGGVLEGEIWLKNENPNEPRAKEIIHGNGLVIESGQQIWIPAGVPHMHRSHYKARSWITKIPIKK